MTLLSSRITLDTIILKHSLFYHNYSNPELPKFIHKFCDEFKLEQEYDLYELDNNKELSIVHEINKYDNIQFKRTKNIFLLNFIKHEFQATKFITNYIEDELYTEFVNDDNERFVMHPQIDMIKIINHKDRKNNSLNIFTSFVIKEEYIQEFRKNKLLELKNIRNKTMLRHFYELYGLNREDKNDHQKIIKLLEKEMGILYSTEPNTIDDLEELALTKLWVGLKGE